MLRLSLSQYIFQRHLSLCQLFILFVFSFFLRDKRGKHNLQKKGEQTKTHRETDKLSDTRNWKKGLKSDGFMD